MTFASITARNALRNRFQTLLTVLAVAFGLICFLLLRTALWAWTVGVEEGTKDRVASWNKVTFQLPLPGLYVGRARQIQGVEATTFANWFGAKDARHPDEFFAPLAVDTDSYFRVYDDMVVPPEQLQAWKQDPQGALLGDALIAKLGYKIGDTVTLEGSTYPGDWQFHVSGVYTTRSRTVDRNQFVFHWSYLNQNVPETQRNEVGWMMSRVDPQRSAEISRALDRTFDNEAIQTMSMSEQAMKIVYLSNFSALLETVSALCAVILAIIMVILGNTIAIRVRERTHEYGVLGALGFGRKHLVGMVLGEGAILGALGGLVGLGLAYLLINKGVGPFLEENMNSFFPYFKIPAKAATAAVVLAILLAAAAAAIPAALASRLRVADALRRID